MAGFCGSCGFPSSANSTFCTHCGARSAGGSAPAQPAVQPLRAPASGSGLKIVMVVLGCLFVAGAAMVGGLWYVAHRVKQVVVEKAKENGVDLNIIPPAKTSFNRHKTHKACELLSKEEAAGLLGEPIERSEPQDNACLYFGPAGLSAKLAQEQASGTFKKAQAPNSDVNGMEVANAVDQLAMSIGAASGQMKGVSEMPLLMLAVTDDGRPAMAAMNASGAIFGGIFHAADPEGKAGNFGAHIQGLGDQAVRLPKLGLNVLQGDTMIGVIAGPVPGADEKTISIARTVLKRL